MQETKICPICKREVAENAYYCEHCNYSFISGNSGFTPAPETYYSVKGENPVSASEVEVYVHKNTEFYKKSFQNLENGKKVGWNWPVFILTLIFGALGTACWFFYRKCKKMGAIMLVVAIATSAISIVSSSQMVKPVFTRCVELASEYRNILHQDDPDDILDSILEDDFDPSSFKLPTDSPEVQKFLDEVNELRAKVLNSSLLINMINSWYKILTVVLAVLFGMYANRIYKNDCIKKINRIKQNFPGNILMLSDEGGTSVGWIFGCIGIYFLASVIIIIAFIANIIGQILSVYNNF